MDPTGDVDRDRCRESTIFGSEEEKSTSGIVDYC